jgi:hypothetical protein
MVTPPVWEDNSCYIDTVLYTLHLLAPDIVSEVAKTLKPTEIKVAKALQKAVRELNIRKIRSLFETSSIEESIDWTSDQMEPIDVVTNLSRFFVLPQNIYKRETIYGSDAAKCKQSDNKVISDSVTQSHFASFRITADVDKKLTYVVKEKEYIPDWGRGYKYKGVVNQYLIDGFAMIHIDRNKLNVKSMSRIDIPKRLQCKPLRAIIVHVGRRSDSGHYIAYINLSSGWIKYDDMNTPSVQEIGAVLPQSVYTNCSDVFYGFRA